MPDVAMPRLSDSMEEGTILKWLKSEGDEVKRGEELVEIETDKANMTYEADQDGTLQIVAQEGDTLPVGETIARIGEAAESDGAGAAPAQESKESEEGGGESRPRSPKSRPGRRLHRPSRRRRPTAAATVTAGASRRPRSRGGWRRRWVSSSAACRAAGRAGGS
jgi:pyruvate dehydrogenase E2 component (dihydrolipoamide acetyltransferase)